jgi:DNA helicase II / ATP-dependent DNA helicase PcrA
MDLMKDLNPEQLEAVKFSDGPLLIVAGAGTGKTTVITQRIAYLIEQGKAGAEEILAMTFTEKAAGEMADRVESLLPYGYFDLWISTFHSFAERLLKEHGLSIGLPTDFKLLNEFEQWALVKKNLDKFNLDYYRPLGNPTKFIRALIKHFSRAKDENIGPKEYLEYADGLKQDLDNMLGGADKSTKEQEVARLNEVANAYHVYEQLLLDNNALDFGDLINYTLKLFRERPAILEKYRKQFKYILLDEFQDTNWSQYELIKILAAPKNNLVVLADDDQSIFRFRGASMSNILQFSKDYPKTKKIVLTKNYRSAQNILDKSYEFIKQNNPNRLEWQLAKTDKLNKRLLAQNKARGEIAVIKGADLADEVKQVVLKIIELKKNDKQASWNDFAILVRANDSARDFTAELDRLRLPYIFGASRGLYFKPVIMDIISYFKLLDNYHESAALYRILNLPVFNFTYEELVNFNHLAVKKAWSLFEVLNISSTLQFKQDLEKKIKPVLALIAKHSSLAREKNVSEVFLAFMNDSGYLKYLSRETDQKSLEALSLLNQFLIRIQTFERASDEKTVRAFLQELNLELEAGEEGGLSPELEAGPEAIKILTVHGAKGLEFKYVFIANLVDKRFPTTERSEQISLPDALIKEILPEGDVHLEEERRLFYVAMTRAKFGLYFSWAEDYGGIRKKKPSRFLVELGLAKDDKSPGVKAKLKFEDNPPAKSAKSGAKKLAEEKINLPLPNHFSYSQLAAYSACPYQYRFAHILKIPVMGKEQFSFGKTLHAVMQKLFILINEKKGLGQAGLFDKKKTASATVTLEEILKLYEQSWIDDWYRDKASKAARKKQGQEILKVFYEKYKDNWPNVLFLEKGFNLKIAGDNKEAYIVRGVIDRIDQAGAGIKLVDYKTGAPKEKLDFSEKEQLLIYQLAAEELFNKKVEALAFYYLDNNSEVEFIGSKSDLEKIKDKIIKTIGDIRLGRFGARPGALCAWCDYREICEYRK